MKTKPYLTAALFLTMLLFGGCSKQNPDNPIDTQESTSETQGQTTKPDAPVSMNTTTDVLDKNRELWKQSSIAQYTLEYFVSCFCDSERVTVAVQDNEIVAVKINTFRGEFVRDAPPSEFGNFLKVEGLFDVIESAIGNADVVEVDFHPELGYPDLIYLDYHENATDDELRYLIEFNPAE